MKIAIMQPYFFPYIGYFQLINAVDQFILLDDVQFIRHGWIERNRVLKQNNDWLYIKAPLLKNKGRNTLIKDCYIDNKQNWQDKILAQLQVYKKKAPNFREVLQLLNPLFTKEYNSISHLNKEMIELINDYLGIKTPVTIFSKMDLEIDEPTSADEWALNICKTLGDSHQKEIQYINPIGGKEIFDNVKYKENNIQLNFIETEEVFYDQKSDIFIPWLSIIDVLMFNDKHEVKSMLNKYVLS